MDQGGVTGAVLRLHLDVGLDDLGLRPDLRARGGGQAGGDRERHELAPR